MLEQRVQGKGRSLCTLDRIVMPLEDAPTTALAEKNEFVRGICTAQEEKAPNCVRFINIVASSSKYDALGSVRNPHLVFIRPIYKPLYREIKWRQNNVISDHNTLHVHGDPWNW